MSSINDLRLRIAAINFLNPAPLMWDFEHPPFESELALRYRIERMSPAQCADRLAAGTSDIGLIPIAALAHHPELRILPGSTIASKSRVRSLLLVRRAKQSLADLRSVAADAASRTTLAYARILFHKWGNPEVPFVPAFADLDAMLEKSDAAILIGDPALLALEERENRLERTDEQLVYHDLAQDWIALTGLPFVSAVWCASAGCALDDGVVEDLNQSRRHGMQNIDALAAEWATKMPVPESTIRTYLSHNIHYTLDQECIEGMNGFFRAASELSILPSYSPHVEQA